MISFLLYLGLVGTVAAIFSLALGLLRAAMWLAYTCMVLAGLLVFLGGCAPTRDEYWSRLTPAVSDVINRR